MKNKLNILSTQWPSYIDPENQEKLTRTKLFNKKEYLSSDSASYYPVIKGIPRILKSLHNYNSAFGEQWKLFRKTQLDTYTKTNISRNRLFGCLGQSILNRLKNSKKELNVLEVGCGAGRFTEILLNFPSIKLTSLDMSSAVEANNLNFPQNKNHRIIQADITKCPFKPMTYDIVICLGVIQHTPNPEKTIKKLYDQVKPGGNLVFDHYTWDISRITKITSIILRPFIKRLSNKHRISAIKYLVNFFLPIHRLIRNKKIIQKIFSRISPIVSYYHIYPEFTDKLQKEWSMLDTHDNLTDWYKHLRTSKQISNYLKSIEAKSINVWKGGNGVEARCKRPLR